MPPSSSQIRSLAADFQGLTGASERSAIKYLKASGYQLNDAVDSYLSSSGAAPRKNPLETKLDALFDSLRDAENDEKDKMELESTMSYLGEKLGVSLENAELFVAMELVKAPNIGEIGRAGFVSGWLPTRCETTEAQASYIKHRVSQLSSDMSLFKIVYRHAFIAGREKDQKALSLENALIYWGMLFSEPGWQWKSNNQDWLEHWRNFLNEKWTRTVSKDMWNMTFEFALKSVEDETLSFWSEDGAWPSVIDDFVEWCKQKGISKSDTMDVDATNW